MNEGLNRFGAFYQAPFDTHFAMGTEDNPFDNIDDAADFILRLEKDALEKQSRPKPAAIMDPRNRQLLPTWRWPGIGFNAPDLPDHHYFFNHVTVPPGQHDTGRMRFSLKPNLTRRKFLFRGQDQYHKRCVPTLFRDKDKDYFLSEMILCQEMEVLIKSHPLVKLLGIDGFELNGIPMELSINYGGINQHYSNHSTYLDLTSDIEVAKFFAVGVYHKTRPHYTPSLHENNSLGVLYFYDMFPQNFEFQAFPSPHNFIWHLSTIGKQIFPRSGAQRGFLFDMVKGLNFNNMPNVFKVYFRHNRDIAKRIVESYDYGEKIMPWSILDDYWDEKMSSRATDRLVSIDAVQINLERNRHETKSSLLRKLKQRGFTITNKRPVFTAEHLRSYYQDIKNGWWDDIFCKDLSFYGEDGAPMTRAFLNMPSRREYQSYFYN